jgi:hypothetical protein
MKILLSMLIVVLFLLSGISYSQAPDYFARNEMYRAQINGEIQRAHELEMEIAKAETYAKELELQRDDIQINSYNRAANYNKIDNDNSASSSIRNDRKHKRHSN